MAFAFDVSKDELSMEEQQEFDITLLRMAGDENAVEIDDLPENVNDIIVNHINRHTFEDKNENGYKILELIKNNSHIYPHSIMTNILLEGVKGNEFELKYNDDKILCIDYRFWGKTNEALLTIEDKYSTSYCEYNREIKYLDEKIDLPRILECLRQKITSS